MSDELLSDDQIEHELQESLRRLSGLKAKTVEGKEAIRIALAGSYAAAINLAKSTGRDGS